MFHVVNFMCKEDQPALSLCGLVEITCNRREIYAVVRQWHSLQQTQVDLIDVDARGDSAARSEGRLKQQLVPRRDVTERISKISKHKIATDRSEETRVAADLGPHEFTTEARDPLVGEGMAADLVPSFVKATYVLGGSEWPAIILGAAQSAGNVIGTTGAS